MKLLPVCLCITTLTCFSSCFADTPVAEDQAGRPDHYAVRQSTLSLEAYATHGPDDDILEVVETCIRDQASPGRVEAVCYGLITQACPEMAGTTVDMVSCSQAELGFWEARMQKAQAELIDILKAEDAEMSEEGLHPFKLAVMAENAQASWTDWRADQCAYAYALYRGGSLGRITGAACMARLTAHRSAQIEQMTDNHSAD